MSNFTIKVIFCIACLAGSPVFAAQEQIGNAQIRPLAGISVSKLAAQTASKAAAFDASGFLVAGSCTATELGYLSGVTSSIQTQLDAKAPSTSGTSILKGNGSGGFSSAVSGTDYSAGTSGLATGIVKSTTVTGALTIAVAGDFPTLNQSTSGNAATATALASNPTDCSANNYATTIDASGNLTCAQVSLSAGVTGVLPVANGGTNSSTALNNNRVMESIGGAVVEAAAITASRALVSDASGLPIASSVTSTTLAFLDATSSVQTQINGKQASLGYVPLDVAGSNAMTTNLNMAANKVIGLATCSNPGDACPKAYIDAITFATLAPASPAKGTILVYDGSNWVNLAVGADTYVLTAEAAQTKGIKWAAPSGGGGGSLTNTILSTSGTVTPTTSAPSGYIVTTTGTQTLADCTTTGPWTAHFSNFIAATGSVTLAAGGANTFNDGQVSGVTTYQLTDPAANVWVECATTGVLYVSQ